MSHTIIRVTYSVTSHVYWYVLRTELHGVTKSVNQPYYHEQCYVSLIVVRLVDGGTDSVTRHIQRYISRTVLHIRTVSHVKHNILQTIYISGSQPFPPRVPLVF